MASLRGKLMAGGGIGPVEETGEAFLIRRLVSDDGGRLKVESIRVPKMAGEEWLAQADLPSGRREPVSDARAFMLVRITGGQGNGGGFTGSAPYTDRYTRHCAVWTGTEMIVWVGGGDPSLAGAYNPATDTWRLIAAAPVEVRQPLIYSTAVWTGSEMIVYAGGWQGRYDPRADAWRSMSTVNNPGDRIYNSAIWTGSEMIVWGGADNETSAKLNTGARYNPVSDVWRPTSTGANVPSARDGHMAVWKQHGDDRVGRLAGHQHRRSLRSEH